MMVFFSPLPRSSCLGLSPVCRVFLEFQVALVAVNSLHLFVLGWRLQPCPSDLDPTPVILVVVICDCDYYNTLCRGLILRHYTEDNHSCRMPLWFLMDDISHRGHTGPAFWHLQWLLIHFQVQLNQVLESDRKPWLFWHLAQLWHRPWLCHWAFLGDLGQAIAFSALLSPLGNNDVFPTKVGKLRNR